MADFTRPEYDSYLVFCQNLRLRPPGVYLNKKGVWELPIGQTTYFCISNDDDEPGMVGYIYYGGGPTETADWWWLPSLADWLEMLEAAGLNCILFRRVESNRWWRCYPNPSGNEQIGDVWEGLWQGDFLMTGGPTREEAAARLWSALNKQAITGDTEPKGK